jgi:hypothetical protein
MQKGFSALIPELVHHAEPVQTGGDLARVFFDRRRNPLVQLPVQRFKRAPIVAISATNDRISPKSANHGFLGH